MQNKVKVKESLNYQKFKELDGSHPLKNVIPNGFVDYEARLRKGGKVTYFNFDLAKEMGLISSDHDQKLTDALERILLETFSIQIINEYDIQKNRTFPKDEMKSGTYMATRYLQLQHEDKKGRTSGDGRSIWNGQIKNKTKVWDISSGGTGGTKLSPATSKYNKFFETGDPSISYGCGYAELDEGIATAIMSKAFKKKGYSTEECLLIVEFKNNISINVRAHECLIRPSHIFMHLKQDNHEELKSIIDYYIETQRNKSSWEKCPKGSSKYDFLLEKFANTFGQVSANFEDDYIFCWMDWDGDNILMDGGIIDYGSIRQFGIFHHEYRYDDVERFSTNILEQKQKARYIVQSFSQAIDFIKSREKSNLSNFSNDSSIHIFEKAFEEQKNYNILWKIGFSSRKIKQINKRFSTEVNEFRKIFSYFEKVKSQTGIIKISDGVNCDVIFNMREALRNLPQAYMTTNYKPLGHSDFLDIIKSNFISKKELVLNQSRKAKISKFQSKYLELLRSCATLFQEDIEDTALSLSGRSSKINKPERITGDAVTFIIDKIMSKNQFKKPNVLYELVQELAETQCFDPDVKSQSQKRKRSQKLNEYMQIVLENREGI